MHSAGILSNDINASFEVLINSCQCIIAFPPTNYSVESSTTPKHDAQTHLSIDLISISGSNFPHCVDRVTRWSEIGLNRRRDLAEQVKAFKRIQIHLHGAPRTIICNNEFRKGEFKMICTDNNIVIEPVPANAYGCNGLV